MAVSERLKLMVNNLVNAPATIITSNKTELLPLLNLKNPIRQVVTRLNAVTNVQITFDFGSAQSISGFGLVGTNLRNGATIELRHSTDNFAANDILLTTLTYAKPTPIINGHVIEWTHHHFFDTLSKRYCRIVANDVGNPAGYTDFGEICWAPALEFEENLAYGWGLTPIDTSLSVRSPGGVPWSDRRVLWSEFSCEVKFLSETESWDTLYPIIQMIGTSMDFWVVPFPLATTGLKRSAALYGRFVVAPGLKSETTIIKTFSTNQIVIAESL